MFINNMAAIALVMLLFFIFGCEKEAVYQNNTGKELVLSDDIYINTAPHSVTVEWAAIEGADGYVLEIGEGTSLTTVLASSDTIQTTSYTFDNLEPQTDGQSA